MPGNGMVNVREERQPLWLVFAPVFVAVYLLHLSLLHLPYFWDEGGYYIPAAWDFFRLGTLIPQTTMSNAHPPLPSVLLAAWWKLTGFHVYSTRLLMCLVTSGALLGVFRLARRLAGETTAWVVLVLTALYPVWFAQSTLAHADMFAAAFTVWGLSFYVGRPGWVAESPAVVSSAISAGMLFSLAALSKETAIVVPAGLFCSELWMLVMDLQRRKTRIPNARDAAPGLEAGSPGRVGFLVATAMPVVPLVAWYAYHRAKTGFTFGNPEYLRYNATANLSAARVVWSLWHRLIHLTVHMNLFVPVLLTMAVLLLPRERREPRIAPRAMGALAVVVLVHWVAFAVLGGALLTRYLLPAYPVVLLLCAVVWQQRTRWWPAVAVLTAVAFAFGCEVNPPYPFAPEDNLAYRDMIVLHQDAIRVLQARLPGATVLTAWPAAAELQRPELGYLRQPMKTVELQNFTAEQVQKAAEDPGAYDAALVFSTKYNPPPGGLNFASTHAGSDARYFDAHRDLLPVEIARALGGRVVWQEERRGQWAAVLRFDRSYDAELDGKRRLWLRGPTPGGLERGAAEAAKL